MRGWTFPVHTWMGRIVPMALFFGLAVAVLTPRASSRVLDGIAEFPCSVVEDPGWPLEGLSLSHGTPLLEITDDGSHLVIGDIRERRVFLLDRAGSITELDVGISVADIEAASLEVKVPEWLEIPGRPAIPSQLAAIAEWKGIIYVLSQIHVPWPREIKPTYLDSNSFRRLQRFDVNGTYLGGWIQNLRWTESAWKESAPMAVDATGNVYVAGRDGVIVAYDSNGRIFHRWKTLTEEAEDEWLNPDWKGPRHSYPKDSPSAKVHERVLEERRSTQALHKADIERMKEAGEVTFQYVRTKIMPAIPSGLAVDEEGDLFLSATGLGGVLEISPSGICRYHLLPTKIGGREVHIQPGDLALRGGMLYVAGGQRGVFAMMANGQLLGYLRSSRGYGLSGSQVVVAENGHVYVADRNQLPPDGYWLEVFVPD